MSLPVFSLAYFDDGRKQFAEALADVVSDIDLRNEPVTVGIKGDWGSGKSLALRAVMERLKANGLEVVEFFPWQSSNPANLIEDFFKTLSEALHPRNRRLSRKLLTYSNRLIELDLHKRLNALGRVGRLLSGTYYSIATARETIERELAKLPKGVAVLIDDIDRLDGDELFETLRLIRNTAHFNNIAYVVAYDEEYVVKMLQSKGVANAERYLDKIFRLNMPLPAFEAYTYVGVIMRQLKRMYSKGSPDFTLLSRLVTRPSSPSAMEYLLNGLITNYRQAVAFASFIIARYEILKRSMPDFQDNINVAEWYGLQLICFFFPELYRRLERHPESLLSNIFDTYRFSDDPTEPDKFSPSETRLLSMLFGGKPALGNERGIAHVKNYYNYFAMRVLKTEVSQKEFSAMLNHPSGELEPILNEWLARRPSVVNSVSALFARHKLTKLSAMEAANYTEALILWWLLSGDFAALAAIDDIPVTPYNVEAFHSGQESYFYTLNALVGRENFDVIRLCQAIKIQSYPPEDPRAGEDDDYDEPLRFLNEAESNILFSNLVDKAFERGLVKGVDDLADKDSLLTNILWNSETEIELEDGFIMAINWAVEEVIRKLEEMVKLDPQTKGKNLAGFREIYEPQYTGDQETDADRVMESERLIRRTFGSHDRYQQVIAELFES